uniref:CSN12-like protein n=1 Tax=Ascaris lumbricoides TaxID=6252 RepID=A0A0M3IR23_ASCLU
MGYYSSFTVAGLINKLNLLKPLIRAIEADAELYEKFSMADKVTYNYYLGRKAMFDSDLALSERSLSYAFRNCPLECKNNKRLILMYLIPVKMFLGHMPTTALLEQFQLEQFLLVVESVKDGNLKKLDEAFSQHEHFFVDCGIFLMLEKANIVASNQIPLESFMHALHWLGIDDIDEDELECILANLIAEASSPMFDLSPMTESLSPLSCILCICMTFKGAVCPIMEEMLFAIVTQA